MRRRKQSKPSFIVINADDYYGKEGFKAVHDYLVNGGKSYMSGFVLKKTLSDNGGVTRVICKMDAENNLTEVVETKNIVKTADGAEADGKVIDVNSLVSMNMWGLTPDFLDVLEEGFKEFFEKEVPGNPLKAEYLIHKSPKSPEATCFWAKCVSWSVMKKFTRKSDFQACNVS